MAGLCLFDSESLRIVGVNTAWSKLFGYGYSEALALRIADLAVAPQELYARIPQKGSHAKEAPVRGLFRRADGSQLTVDYTLTLHTVGASGLVCLLFSDAGSASSEEEWVSETGLPPHLRAAMRDRIGRWQKQQAALLTLASADDRDFEALMKKVLQMDAETLEVARVSYWTIGKGGGSIVCEALLDVTKGDIDRGAQLFARDFPVYFDALATGVCIPAHDARNDPRTREFRDSYLAPLGIGAMLDVPVFVKGELVGVVCHEHVGGPRGWTMDEQQFALCIGQMFSLAHAARQREEASRSLAQRETALAEANLVLARALEPDDGGLTGGAVGRYDIGKLIGRGGMGEVYRAIDRDTREAVAVKVLRQKALKNPDHVQRFFREARIAATVPTDHVARILEVGSMDDGTPYIAMELLYGHDLAWHLRRTSQLGLDQVVELCEHTSRALAAVRDAGVVHRDLKPANLFLVDAIPRRWKVLDFGLSRAEGDPFMTSAEEIAGSPHYMAPEQICGDPTDHRADLYSLAAVAYRALTGRPPHTGDLQTVLMSSLTEPVPSPTSLVRGVPVEVDLVFAIGLAKEREERFENVETFAAALAEAAGGSLSDPFRAAGWRLLKRRA